MADKQDIYRIIAEMQPGSVSICYYYGIIIDKKRGSVKDEKIFYFIVDIIGLSSEYNLNRLWNQNNNY